MFIIGLITGMIAGGMVSAVLICAVTAGDRADYGMGYGGMERGGRPEDAGEDRRYIRFVDIFDHELFCIEDGECIELFAGDGRQKTCLCRYQDKRHASIDGKRWEMLDFARKMDRDSIIYIPAVERIRGVA